MGLETAATGAAGGMAPAAMAATRERSAEMAACWLMNEGSALVADATHSTRRLQSMASSNRREHTPQLVAAPVVQHNLCSGGV